ncbi:hypothetical protein AYI70_g6821 [Smittium culicis]|uniref:Uncharacterized protein n=1 Tax=Smittium culicis TaxID=133412 RepID=A0A1R1XN85_9FUNG|nr:hypothetical protein AYI70_g6821 [Smittium culicis]
MFDLMLETLVKISTLNSNDADSLSVYATIDECDSPSVYPTMRCFDFPMSSNPQILEYFKMLRIMRPKIVALQETIIKSEQRSITIPGYEDFHIFAREGSNQCVLLGIFKGHVAQKVSGIQNKLAVPRPK